MADPVGTILTSGSSMLATTVASFTAQPTTTYLLLQVQSDDYATGDPAGWTRITSGEDFLGHYLWGKFSDGSETSVSYTIGSAAASSYQVASLTNVDPTTPFGTVTSLHTHGGATTGTTAITPTAGTRWFMLASFGGMHSGASSLDAAAAFDNGYTILGSVTGTATTATEVGTLAYLALDGGTSTSTATTSPGWTVNSPSCSFGLLVAFKVASGLTSVATSRSTTWNVLSDRVNYVGAGTFTSGSGALTVPLPAGATTGDLLLMGVESANEAVATPSGWTAVPSGQAGTGTAAAIGAVAMATFWRWYAAGSASVADSGNHTTARIIALRNVDPTTPLGTAVSRVDSSGTTTFTSASVTVPTNGMQVVFVGLDRDAATTDTELNAVANATLVGSNTVTTGVGGGVGVLYSTTTGALTQTGGFDTSLAHAYVSIPINPATSTISVSTTRSTTWGVSASVSASRATTWNVASLATAVTATRSTLWTTRASLLATRQAIWSVRIPATTSRVMLWNTRASLIAARSTTWSVSTSVTPSRVMLWNVQPPVLTSAWPGIAYPGATYPGVVTSTSVSATRSTSWSVQAATTAARATTWTVRTATAPTRSTTWTVRVSVSPSRSSSWTVRASAASSRTLLWATLASVVPSRATTWNVAAFITSVTATRSLLWNTIGSVPASRVLLWSALTPAVVTRPTTWVVGTSTTAARSTSWAVRSPVLASRATTWTVRTPVLGSRASTWTVRGAVSASRSTLWNVDSLSLSVSASRSTTWAVVGRVPATRVVVWSVLTPTSVARAPLWSTRTGTAGSRATSWSVNAQRSTTRVMLWSTRTPTSAFRVTSWDVRTSASPSRATTWRVLEAVPVPRSVVWSVDTPVTVSRAVVWNVLTTAPSTDRSMAWAVLQAVVASRVLRWGTRTSYRPNPLRETFIPAEKRTLTVFAESRTFTVPR